MENGSNISYEKQTYASTLKEVTDVFESCGCSTEVSITAPQQATLVIKGPISFCPTSIFEEHVEKAKELMQMSHPHVAFTVEAREENI
jgi:hypothetical protein